jgi:hypothetical protein
MKSIGTTASRIFSSEKPITFVLSVPQSNTDFVMVGEQQKSFGSGEEMIPMFPGEKHQYDKFKGELWAQANSGTQYYVIRTLKEGTILVIANAPGPLMVLNTVTGLTEIVRTASITKPVALTNPADGTAVWTPASGKKFRVMGWCLTGSVGATKWLDDGVGGTHVYTPSGDLDIVNLPGNGYLSTLADNALVTKGMSSGSALHGTIWGTEE